jgi:hypothetical protein
MTLSQSYARALYEASSSSGKSAHELMKNMHEALKRRGHEKLLPRIISDYEKLAMSKERLEEYRRVTPEAEQTRVLLELYRKLTASTEHI